MNELLSSVVSLLGQLSGSLDGKSALVATIIKVLAQLIPVIVTEARDLVQPVKNIIAALTDSGVPDAEQLAALKALDAKVDADFEAEAVRWEKP